MALDDFRRSLRQTLQDVSRATEEVYLSMGTTYPALITELEGNFGRDQVLIEGTPVGEVLRNLNIEAEQAIASFQLGYQTTSASVMASLQDLRTQGLTLEQLGGSVEEIREDSIAMELISLNAMVVAAKAGRAGAAFGCITNELKALSNQAVGLTQEVISRKTEIDRLFGVFQQDIEANRGQEAQGLDLFFSTTGRVFQTMDSTTTGLMEELEAIHSRAEEVTPPLVKILVEVQNQDRIRQSIDHVLLSLDQLEEAQADQTLEERLQGVTQRELLPQLCSHVLGEVQEQIQENRRVFGENLGFTRALVTRLEEERQQFVRDYLHGKKAQEFQFVFTEGQERLERFIAQQESLLRTREVLVRQSLQLQASVQLLVDRLQLFDGMLHRFRNIDMLSRIQVAGHSALASMKDNAQATSELTRKIGDDVRLAMERATEFAQNVRTEFEEFRSTSSSWMGEVAGFLRHLQALLHRFLQVRTTIFQHLDEGQVFSHRFETNFQKTTGDLGALDQLLETMAAQQTQIQGLKALAERERTQLLQENHLSGWSPDTELVKRLVQKFTIFSQKKFAADLLDFEIEASVASGDVTLF